MKRFMMAQTALMLMTAMIVAVGCNPEDDPNNGGGNGNDGFIPEYVDLGLPSGTLWATCNLGATTPEGYGNYYAWGETQPKDSYTWENYRYCNGSSDQLTKYCSVPGLGYGGFTDSLTVLLPEDDAATVLWGDGWQTPSYDQCRELEHNTSNFWTVRDGVNGRVFTAKNGNSIFLPASGGWDGDELNNVGVAVHYWGNHILYEDRPKCAYDFAFGVNGFYTNLYGTENRQYGRPIRPVRSAK